MTGVTFTEVFVAPDVTVEGYPTYIGDTDSPCKDSVACVDRPTSIYPELGVMILYFETPPIWGTGPFPGVHSWTNSQTEMNYERKDYMPGIMMHEFGHAAGLGHSVWPADIMGYSGDKTALATNDITAMRAIYQNHVAHTR